MALIPAYKHQPQRIAPSSEAGGFNKRTRKFTPFNSMPWTYEVLDALTSAVEAGVIDTDKWVSQVFASGEVFNEFLEELYSYDDCYRIPDRWWQALALIAGHETVEEGFVLSSEIADRLREQAEESNQI